MKRSGKKIKLTSYDELLGIKNEESSIDIDIDRIDAFKNHPFKVLDDEKMDELVESIRKNGVLTPVLVRPFRDRYEMISGHRRKHAASLAGLTSIPAIIKDIDDDEATIMMVDTNIQREELLPSERAFAYKMKMDAMFKQGKRTDLTSVQNDPKLSTEIIGEEFGISSSQVKRYIRLTELIPEILDMLDEKELQFTVAVETSYIDSNIQKWIYEYAKENGVLKLNQVKALRSILKERSISQLEMIQILNNNLKGREPNRKVTISHKKLDRFFPESVSSEKIESLIIALLEKWKDEENDYDI